MKVLFTESFKIIIQVTNSKQMSRVVTYACVFGKVANLGKLFSQAEMSEVSHCGQNFRITEYK